MSGKSSGSDESTKKYIVKELQRLWENADPDSEDQDKAKNLAMETYDRFASAIDSILKAQEKPEPSAGTARRGSVFDRAKTGLSNLAKKGIESLAPTETLGDPRRLSDMLGINTDGIINDMQNKAFKQQIDKNDDFKVRLRQAKAAIDAVDKDIKDGKPPVIVKKKALYQLAEVLDQYDTMRDAAKIKRGNKGSWSVIKAIFFPPKVEDKVVAGEAQRMEPTLAGDARKAVINKGSEKVFVPPDEKSSPKPRNKPIIPQAERKRAESIETGLGPPPPPPPVPPRPSKKPSGQ